MKSSNSLSVCRLLLWAWASLELACAVTCQTTPVTAQLLATSLMAQESLATSTIALPSTLHASQYFEDDTINAFVMVPKAAFSANQATVTYRAITPTGSVISGFIVLSTVVQPLQINSIIKMPNKEMILAGTYLSLCNLAIHTDGTLRIQTFTTTLFDSLSTQLAATGTASLSNSFIYFVSQDSPSSPTITRVLKRDKTSLGVSSATYTRVSSPDPRTTSGGSACITRTHSW